MEKLEKLRDLPLEIQVLRELDLLADPGCICDFKRLKNKRVELSTGTLINEREWKVIIREFYKKGLVYKRRGASPPYLDQYKTITRYYLTGKGREVLKELGL